MPSVTLGASEFNRQIAQDGRFSRYAPYFAENQIQRIKQYECFGMVFGKKRAEWQPNMGLTMAGLRIEPTPRGESLFFPRPLGGRPLVDIFEQGENREETPIYWHKCRSNLINFLGPFVDWFRDQVMPLSEDIADQIVWKNEAFLRTYVWNRSPHVYLAGVGLLQAPNSGQGAISTTAAQTNLKQAWLADKLASVTAPLSLETVQNAALELQIGQQAAGFSGGENSVMQNKYLLITNAESASQWYWGDAFERLKNNNKEYFDRQIEGVLFGNVAVKFEQTPLNWAPDGTAAAPDVWIPRNPVSGEDAALRGDKSANPTYANIASSPWTTSWLIGADAYRSMKIGPPPAPFAGSDGVSPNQLRGMVWNGRVWLSRNELINDAAGNIDTNADGEFVRLRSTMIMGCLAGRAYNAIPIVHRRKRAAEPNA